VRNCLAGEAVPTAVAIVAAALDVRVEGHLFGRDPCCVARFIEPVHVRRAQPVPVVEGLDDRRARRAVDGQPLVDGFEAAALERARLAQLAELPAHMVDQRAGAGLGMRGGGQEQQREPSRHGGYAKNSSCL